MNFLAIKFQTRNIKKKQMLTNISIYGWFSKQNVSIYTSCASAKKKTPTMEILPDKKELIMKGGTFQEQLSAFQ
ncbi:MAG: hypothetical protein R2750_13365 [Bacteroidales bacterium]